MILVIGNKNYSSWSLRVWFLLKHLRLEFAEIRLPLATQEFHSSIRDYSPTDKVPVLQDGSIVIWDSLAICEYLADKYPKRSLWPDSRSARAYARSVCAEMHSGFADLRQQLPMNCRAKNRQVEFSNNVIRDIARVQAIWNTCRSRWDHLGPWLLGRFSIADAVFIPMASRFCTYGVQLGMAEQAWADMVLGTEAYQSWLQDAIDEPELIFSEEAGAASQQTLSSDS